MPGHSLKSCPHSPNCVSSLATDAAHRVEPLSYNGDWQMAKQTLRTIIQGSPRAQVLTDHQDYMHAVFVSRWFGFVDDVELVFDDAEKVIHIRSASQVGFYDFGVNRRRVQWLRDRLTG